MAWTTMPKFRPGMPQHRSWLNVFSNNLQHIYDTMEPKSFVIPEPSLPDDYRWRERYWFWKNVDDLGIEYNMVYQPDRRWLWYLFILKGYAEAKDPPHLTFGFEWLSADHSDGYTLDAEADELTSGFSTSSGVGSLTDSGATWVADAYIGSAVRDGENDVYTITDNTGTVLTLDTTETPVVGSYAIYSRFVWGVVDLQQVPGLVPGMVLSVHTVRCAMLRTVSE